MSKKDEVILSDDGSLDLLSVALEVTKNLRILVLIPIVFSFFTAVYVQFFAEHSYTSTAKIISSSSNSNQNSYLNLAAEFGINLGSGNKSQSWSYPDIIKSRNLAKTMLYRKFDTKSHGKNQFLIDILANSRDSSEKIGAEGIERKITKFKNMIKVSENLRSGVFSISISAHESALSKSILEALLEELSNHQQNYDKIQTTNTKQFINQRIQATGNELIAKEDSLKNFMIRNRQIQNSPFLQLERERISREVSVLTSVFTNLKQQLENTKIQEMKESDYVLVLDSPSLPLYRSKPAKTKSVLISFFMGFFISFILIFVSSYLDRMNKKEKKILAEIKNTFSYNIKKNFRRNF